MRENFLRNIIGILPSNPVCIELGVLHGDCSVQIIDILKPSKLFLVDPFVDGGELYDEGMNLLPTAYSTEQDLINLRSRLSTEIISGQVTIRRNYSYDAVKDFIDTYFDFIYIDACHLYECVKRDLQDYLPKLKNDGLLCGHDYVQSKSFGVIRAVDDFVKDNDLNLLIIDTNFILQRK